MFLTLLTRTFAETIHVSSQETVASTERVFVDLR